jgi:excisionase family DNA binding protein
MNQTQTKTNIDSAESLLIGAECLANLLQLSTRTLWRLVHAGKIPAPLRIGRSVRWKRSEIEQWIEAGCPKPKN